MEMMKAVVASPPRSLDLVDIYGNGSSNCSTPYMSAPSSPQRPLNFFFYSAPTSPSHNPFLFHDPDHVSLLSHTRSSSSSSSVPFNWELKPGVPKASENQPQAALEQGHHQEEDDDDFEFDFSGQLDMMVRPSLSSADELFDGGKIRPLKPPPRLHIPTQRSSDSSSPKSPMSKFKDALSLSPKHRRKDLDPFEAALHNTRSNWKSLVDDDDAELNRGRGRQIDDKMKMDARANSRKGISRSLSPLRVSEFANESTTTTTAAARGSRKWRLKDLFLFRSASEGRAATGGMGKDPLRKYFKKNEEDSKRWSFRSSTSTSESGSVSRRRGQVSAHELHYTANKAASDEMKKKTSLPYKHGLLGCLGFNPVLQDFSKAFSSFSPP